MDTPKIAHSDAAKDKPEPELEAPLKTTPKNKEVYWLAAGAVLVLLLIMAYKFNKQSAAPTQAQPSPVTQASPATSSDPMATWQTYTNAKYDYSIKYSEPDLEVKKYNKYTDDLIEINGMDNLVIRIEPILTSFTNPAEWLASQKVEIYSKKPLSCFTEKNVSEIKSLYEPNKTIITFNDNVLMLDNLVTEKDKDTACYAPAQIRVLIISHNNKLLKITYTYALEAEQVLSTFKFIEAIKPDSSKWKTYVYKQIPNSIYQISYPENWELTTDSQKIDRFPEGKNIDNHLFLRNGSLQITIYRPVAASPNACNYPDLPRQELQSSDYAKFKEIKLGSRKTRRSPANQTYIDKVIYTFCQVGENSSTFTTLTEFGDISYSVPNNTSENTLTKMDEIIQTLKHLE